VEEIPAVRTRMSPSTGRRYPLTMLCQVWRVARSSVYAPTASPRGTLAARRGPKPVVTDTAVAEAIRACQHRW
jgi:putative transposase